MRKISEKWMDEETSIQADITPTKITLTPGTSTIYAQKSGENQAFVFKKSSREVVKKVLESLLRLNSIALDESVWLATEIFYTEIIKYKNEHPETTSTKNTSRPVLPKVRKTSGRKLQRKNNF